jgi:class 3 adenylate cyclase
MTRQPASTSVKQAEGAIVFTDIVGFTEFTALQGDEAALKLLATQDRVVEEVIDDQGRVVKNLGDGLLMWFDDPCAAVRSSLTLQSRFEEESFEEDLPLWVRIGIHFGRPAQRGQDLIGHDVNVAARIVGLAAPGEVLVSEACTHRVVDRNIEFEFEEVGPVMMKGIPDPVSIFRAVAL